MTLPYQCLAACTRYAVDSHEWILFGATGSQLAVQSSTGAVSTWTPEDAEVEAKEPKHGDEDEGPPGKRIKLSPAAGSKPNFSVLKTTKNGRYLVAVTAEDKCIRVFQTDAECRLQQLSQRCMAKRPSSIVLTSDDMTILCADKFGDVYSLPLLPSPEDELSVAPERKEDQKKFAPSANLLTVHSGRNRKTLDMQLKQAETGPKKVKETPKFKHDLLLGHVSMLTDLAYATVGSRSYILTADRDEHIRVSRGPPQAHIIEGFCQGHEEFISRLCLTKSRHLVSGGGDPYLYVWDWLFYRLLEKVPLRDAVLGYYKAHPQLSATMSGDEKFRTAVSGIWSVPNSEPEVDEILVACEGVPALVSFRIGSSATSGQVLPVDGNVLDVAFIDVQRRGPVAAVSVDHLHKPGSTTEMRNEKGDSRLQYFSSQNPGEWNLDRTMAEKLKWFNCGEDTEGQASSENRGTVDDKALRDLLYGVENLRKRPGAEDQACVDRKAEA